MVGPADIFSRDSFAHGFANTATISSRPRFELAFNALQNTLIDRLNDKVEEVTADDGLVNNIDPFLVSSQKRLQRFQADLDHFIFDNSRNINAAGGLAQRLDSLQTALNNNNTDDFNAILGKINQAIGLTHVSNGTTVGIYIDDGITKMRREGFVSTTDGDGTTVAATARSDFADDAAAQAAIDAAELQIANIASVLLLKAEGAENIRENTAKNIRATILQIEAARIAEQADKANEVAKIREEYGQLLNALSLAFESSQVFADQLGQKLFDPDAVPAGSIVNILL